MNLEFAADDPLYQLAIVLVAGIVGGELVGRIRLPKVTGWIFTGVLLRALDQYHVTATGISSSTPSSFAPYMNFVLGYIAFTVGAALHFASLRNSGKRLGFLLVGEALLTPSIVVIAMYFIGGRIAPEDITFRACLILGAIAIAGAPGTTVLVVQEARARGILTRTLIAAVALIDMIAVGVFVFATDYLVAAGSGDTSWQESWQPASVAVAGEFGLALAIGTSQRFSGSGVDPNRRRSGLPWSNDGRRHSWHLGSRQGLWRLRNPGLHVCRDHGLESTTRYRAIHGSVPAFDRRRIVRGVSILLLA